MNLSLTNLAQLLGETWWVFVIGVAAAGLVFAVGLTARRRRQAPPPPSAGAPPADFDPFTDGGSFERRAAARRAGHPVTVEMTRPEEEAPALQAWVINRSLGGLCLMAPQALPVHSVWKVRPADAPRTAPPVPVRVKTCVGAGAEWKLNCQFEKTPSYAVLLLFG